MDKTRSTRRRVTTLAAVATTAAVLLSVSASLAPIAHAQAGGSQFCPSAAEPAPVPSFGPNGGSGPIGAHNVSLIPHPLFPDRLFVVAINGAICLQTEERYVTHSPGELFPPPIGFVDGLWQGCGVAIAFGGPGDDVLYGIDGLHNLIIGGAGNDRIAMSQFGSNTVVAGDGDDSVANRGEKATAGSIIFTGAGYDSVLGGDKSEHIIVGGERADINSGKGNDVIWVTSVVDEMSRFYLSEGDDRFNGGPGREVVLASYDPAADGKDILLGGGGPDLLEGGRETDVVCGGEGDDWMYGDDIAGNFGADDLLFGDSGSDTVRGGGGDDYLQ